jgi:hypothetical protein
VILGSAAEVLTSSYTLSIVDAAMIRVPRSPARKWFIFNAETNSTVGVAFNKELQVVLNQAFTKAAIARGSGVAFNKDIRTITVCADENQNHKECQRIYPSLPIISSHFSIVSSIRQPSLPTDLPRSFTYIVDLQR